MYIYVYVYKNKDIQKHIFVYCLSPLPVRPVCLPSSSSSSCMSVPSIRRRRRPRVLFVPLQIAGYSNRPEAMLKLNDVPRRERRTASWRFEKGASSVIVRTRIVDSCITRLV